MTDEDILTLEHEFFKYIFIRAFWQEMRNSDRFIFSEQSKCLFQKKKKKQERSIFISFPLMSTEKPPFAATENFWISATNLEKKWIFNWGIDFQFGLRPFDRIRYLHIPTNNYSQNSSSHVRTVETKWVNILGLLPGRAWLTEARIIYLQPGPIYVWISQPCYPVGGFTFG